MKYKFYVYNEMIIYCLLYILIYNNYNFYNRNKNIYLLINLKYYLKNKIH